MFDSIGFFVPHASVNQKTFDKVKWCDQRGIRGNIRNLYVLQRPEGTFIKGSLPKFLKGENIITLEANELPRAIASMEERLDICLQDALIRTIEVSTTIKVDHSPVDYIAQWEIAERLPRSSFHDGKTVVFGNKQVAFKGYDKGLEAGIPILRETLGTETGLRLELCLSRGIKKKLGYDIRFKDFQNPLIIDRLVGMWSMYYYRIRKKATPIFPQPTGGQKQLVRSLATLGLTSIGAQSVESKIHAAQKTGAINTYQASRMRAYLRGLQQDHTFCDPTTLTEELDKKVNEWRDQHFSRTLTSSNKVEFCA